MDDLRLELDLDEIDDLVFDEGVDELLQEVGDQVADVAAGLAQKESGDGAASIHAEVHRGDDAGAFPSTYTPEDEVPTAYVGWDQDHFYMYFQEVGTERNPPRPFLRPALDSTQL